MLECNMVCDYNTFKRVGYYSKCMFTCHLSSVGILMGECGKGRLNSGWDGVIGADGEVGRN